MSSQSKSTFYQIVENPGTMSEVESHFSWSRRETVTGNRRHDHLKDEILISSEMFFCLFIFKNENVSSFHEYLFKIRKAKTENVFFNLTKSQTKVKEYHFPNLKKMQK